MTNFEVPPRRENSVEAQASASDHARIYQVAQGDMYVGYPAERSDAQKIASLPIKAAVEALLEMPREKTIAMLAEMDAASASRRLAELPNAVCVDFLLSVDEQLAYQRLASMGNSRVLELLEDMPVPVARTFISGMPFEQSIELIARPDPDGRHTVDIPTLIKFAPRLPTPALAAFVTAGVTPEACAQALQTLEFADAIVTWLSVSDAGKRNALLPFMPNEWLRGLAEQFLRRDGLDFHTLAQTLSVPTPQAGQVFGALGYRRTAEVIMTFEDPHNAFVIFGHESQIALLDAMGSAEAATLIQGFPQEDFVMWVRGAFARSVPHGGKEWINFARRVGGILANMPGDTEFIFARLTQPEAYQVWEGRWAAGVASQIASLPPAEIMHHLKGLNPERMPAVVWHLPDEPLRVMQQGMTNSEIYWLRQNMSVEQMNRIFH
ncbi:hypothetical protein ACQUSR_01805 [Streptomyces sp. P1-3]|uniref:hypothetical protein n=1 Tax=Streptomyces sp. P1-3 TaxID=3421658 RepID=UPI003D36E869